MIILARGSIHLTPGEINALWHLTRWLGRQFWHLGTWAQAIIAGVPSAVGTVWMRRWDPLLTRQAQRDRRASGTLLRIRRRWGLK